MPPLRPSRAPLTLRPTLPTMLLLRPRNIRRAGFRRYAIIEALLVWGVVLALAVWYLRNH